MTINLCPSSSGVKEAVWSILLTSGNALRAGHNRGRRDGVPDANPSDHAEACEVGRRLLGGRKHQDDPPIFIDPQEMRSRAKTGILTISRIAPNAIAAANSQAIAATGSGAIAIPRTASVEMIRTSATEESTSHRLGRKPHKCWRPRITYVVAWLPNTMPTTDKVWSAAMPRCNWNLPTARMAVEKARKQTPRMTARDCNPADLP